MYKKLFFPSSSSFLLSPPFSLFSFIPFLCFASFPTLLAFSLSLNGIQAMAVQAQYPANLLLLDRAEDERSNRGMDFPPSSLIDQSPVFFSTNGGNANPRKRGREAMPTAFGVPMMLGAPLPPPPQQQSLFSLQTAPTPVMIGLAQLRSPVPAPPVSTGLRLALDEQNQRRQPDSIVSAFISEELASQISQQRDEIEQFLLAQREQLRRAFAERRHRHYRALLAVVEESIGKRFREKEAELERAAVLSTELEDRLVRLRTESMAWQSKAMAEQATATSLHAQLQRATAAAAAAAAADPAGEECCGESPAQDAESAYIDPERRKSPERACQSCLQHPASVVLIPCRHLCLCPACNSSTAGEFCPVCGCGRAGSVQVFLP